MIATRILIWKVSLGLNGLHVLGNKVMTSSRIEQMCVEKGMKMTGQRRVIAQVLSDSEDHPDVEEVYRRSSTIDPKISIATVYRTVRLLEEANIIERLDFGDGRARYEEASENHHDHLIDVQSGKIVEFHDVEIEELQRKIAAKLGYKLVDHRMELFAVPLDAE
jgi:Fur family transcriptional regulator, ferric uptake regulator